MSLPSLPTRAPSVLERALIRGGRGEATTDTVLWVLAAGPIVILNGGPTLPGSFPASPLVLTRDQSRYLALFTHEDRADMRTQGWSVTAVQALEALRRLPEGVGIVINPGQPVGLEVSANEIHEFVRFVTSTA